MLGAHQGQFVEARNSEPAATDEILDAIGALYAVEKSIREQGLEDEAKRAMRIEHAKSRSRTDCSSTSRTNCNA